MDQGRRERIREIIRFLESAQSEVYEIWLDEEAAFDGRSDQVSGEAIDSLSEAADDIESAIKNLREAIADSGP